ALTGGERLARGGTFQTDKERETAVKDLQSEIQKIVPDDSDRLHVEGLLCELFPEFARITSKSWASMPKRSTPDDAKPTRISDPDIFPAYFRYELPQAVFSSVEMASFLRKLEGLRSQSDKEQTFRDVLDSMPKGSLKRDDFLRKLADIAVEEIPMSAAVAVAHAAVKNAAKYSYDTFAAFGEAGHVLRIVLRTAKRMPESARPDFLKECIREAGDDTLALRILQVLTRQEGDLDLKVPQEQLHPSFMDRMRSQYGRNTDATTVDLSTSDPWAFDYWGRDFSGTDTPTVPEDREMQHEFWLRYIGNSRARLANAFRTFFLPMAIYQTDPAPIVERKVAVDDLRRMYDTVPDDGLTADDHKSLETLGRFLNGDFKNGINPLENHKLY
ncbi:MAG: hypothetical protein KGL02_13745, partial [Acidobacteriota bacterium]|nr:hypothetical protein [Acidobacteriota bacterium]